LSEGAGQVQYPDTQVAPALQVTPQPPQLKGSLLVSTQPRGQAAVPLGQDAGGVGKVDELVQLATPPATSSAMTHPHRATFLAYVPAIGSLPGSARRSRTV
jgi:hypothetical protein